MNEEKIKAALDTLRDIGLSTKERCRKAKVMLSEILIQETGMDFFKAALIAHSEDCLIRLPTASRGCASWCAFEFDPTGGARLVFKDAHGGWWWPSKKEMKREGWEVKKKPAANSEISRLYWQDWGELPREEFELIAFMSSGMITAGERIKDYFGNYYIMLKCDEEGARPLKYCRLDEISKPEKN